LGWIGVEGIAYVTEADMENWEKFGAGNWLGQPRRYRTYPRPLIISLHKLFTFPSVTLTLRCVIVRHHIAYVASCIDCKAANLSLICSDYHGLSEAGKGITMWAIVEKDNPLALHGLFDYYDRAERHIQEIIPVYVARGYYMDKSLTAESFMIVKRDNHEKL